MKHRFHSAGRSCLAAITVMFLGFGAAQAFAAPASSEQTRLACDFFTCDESCRAAGYSAGSCTYKDVCRCYP